MNNTEEISEYSEGISISDFKGVYGLGFIGPEGKKKIKIGLFSVNRVL